MSRVGRLKRIVGVCALALCVVASAGCEPTAKEKFVEARTAINAGEADKAEKALDEALKLDPTLVEAERFRWRVFLLRKQYDKAEAELNAFFSKQGLGGDDLPADKKSQLRLVEGDYNELYRLWAEGIGADSPTKYREVLDRIGK